MIRRTLSALISSLKAAAYAGASGIGPKKRLSPVLLGSLACSGTPNSCAIGGTALAETALALQGVTTPAEGCDLEGNPCGVVSLSKIRLVNSVPMPILDLELGPAVTTGICSGGVNDGLSCADSDECTAGTCVLGTRWEMLLRGAQRSAKHPDSNQHAASDCDKVCGQGRLGLFSHSHGVGLVIKTSSRHALFLQFCQIAPSLDKTPRKVHY